MHVTSVFRRIALSLLIAWIIFLGSMFVSNDVPDFWDFVLNLLVVWIIYEFVLCVFHITQAIRSTRKVSAQGQLMLGMIDCQPSESGPVTVPTHLTYNPLEMDECMSFQLSDRSSWSNPGKKVLRIHTQSGLRELGYWDPDELDRNDYDVYTEDDYAFDYFEHSHKVSCLYDVDGNIQEIYDASVTMTDNEITYVDRDTLLAECEKWCTKYLGVPYSTAIAMLRAGDLSGTAAAVKLETFQFLLSDLHPKD